MGPPHSLGAHDEPSRGKFQAAPPGQLPGPFLFADVPRWLFPVHPAGPQSRGLASTASQRGPWDRTRLQRPRCHQTRPRAQRVWVPALRKALSPAGHMPHQEHMGVPGSPVSLHPPHPSALTGMQLTQARGPSTWSTVTQGRCPGWCWREGGLCSVRPGSRGQKCIQGPSSLEAPWVSEANLEVQGWEADRVPE